MNKLHFTRWLSAGLVLGSLGCSDGGDPVDEGEPSDPGKIGSPNTPDDKPGNKPPPSTVTPGDPHVPVSTVLASLSAAANCDDLLMRVQDDAIAKLMMTVEQYKKQPIAKPVPGRPGVWLDAGLALPVNSGDQNSAEDAPAPGKGSPTPSAPPAVDSDFSGVGSGGESATGKDPIGASETNNQVAGIDEADFVKVVEKGKSIYLLHGNTLRKLASWPAAQTALVGKPLTIEGTPSEMFVTDGGKAVVFSTVYSHQSTGGGKPIVSDVCAPDYCGGYGSASLKITVADVSVAEPKVEREIYYEGSYVSSRRYGDVVRAVIQSYSKFSGLFSPQIQWTDAWGRPYEKDEIASQLEEWQQRTEASIRHTELSDWFPVAQQVVDGKLVDIAPGCDSYFVPDPGLADYGLTHVLSLDTASKTSTIGGVTIVGAISTVYSNAAQLVLAQPDYRWNAVNDFGLVNNQQTAYHVFALDGASTRYAASGWLFGTLPAHNPQFGIDVAADGTLRVAATGWARDQPNAKPEDAAFWSQHTENRVLKAKIDAGKVVQTGQSEPLGHKGETVQSARFIGDRGYVVTFRQTDPLIVLDVAAATPKVLGELTIPGFSEYVHPLDANHLVTFGQNGTGGTQLQLFDVTNPAQLPAPKTHDFGSGSSSEVSYNHKAFTAFEDMLALPMYGQFYTSKRGGFSSTLEVLRVNADTGFSKPASIDHSKLYADNGLGVRCGSCDVLLGGDTVACYDYACPYQPELRRGHFVKGEDGKVYVYSFSYAGVLVHSLAPLAPLASLTPVASVGLPAPVFDGGPWYVNGGPVPPPVSPIPVDGGVVLVP